MVQYYVFGIPWWVFCAFFCVMKHGIQPLFLLMWDSMPGTERSLLAANCNSWNTQTHWLVLRPITYASDLCTFSSIHIIGRIHKSSPVWWLWQLNKTVFFVLNSKWMPFQRFVGALRHSVGPDDHAFCWNGVSLGRTPFHTRADLSPWGDHEICWINS